MKLIAGITIGLALVLLNAFTPVAEPVPEAPMGQAFEVYAIHEIEVKPDVDLKEFENFVLTEIAPIYNKMKGQHCTLVKGDRGMRTNLYAIILTFKTIEDRDRIYPPSGIYTEDFGSDELWEKFNAMLINGIGTVHTDYVSVVH